MANKTKTLYAFLHPQTIEHEFVYLDRFRNENGEIEPIEVKALTQKDNNALMRKNTRKDTKTGEEVLNKQNYTVDLVLASICNIDFCDSELQKAYDVVGERDLISAMFTIGEFATISEKVTEICGFDKDINEDIEEAKN